VHIHVATITERKASKSRSSESGVGVRWCTRWYDHDEAVSRLEALRRAWEEHVVKPGAGMSTWYLTHYGPHITALTAPGGPFWQCSPDTTNPPDRSDTSCWRTTRSPTRRRARKLGEATEAGSLQPASGSSA